MTLAATAYRARVFVFIDLRELLLSLRPLVEEGANEIAEPGQTLLRKCGRLLSLASPAKAGDPVFQRRQRLDRKAATYWIPRIRRA